MGLRGRLGTALRDDGHGFCAFWFLVIIFLLALATTLVFGRVRKAAAWLMVPYLAWLCFAAALNKEIDWLNPSAETLVVPAARTQI